MPPEEDPGEEEEEMEEETEDGGGVVEEAQPTAKSVATIYVERRARIDAAKLRIGLLSRALLEDPQQKVSLPPSLLLLLLSFPALGSPYGGALQGRNDPTDAPAA